MAYKDYLKRARKKSESLREYYRKRPNMTYAALGRVFHITRERVRQILNEGDGEHNEQ